MAKRFTPVVDPEKARCEQDEESLRRHRQFDTPFALLPKNLNDPKQPKEDLNPLARPSEDLYQDANKLWRKKAEVFDKKKTWGRETFEYSNPEESRAEGSNATRAWRPGDVGWGVRGVHGGRGEDDGRLVLQRGEVDQALVKNEKGLWVKRKAQQDDPEAKDRERSPTPKGGWRCPKCKEGNGRQTTICKACGIDRTMFEQYRARPGEDPRLEAAKPRGRGTADAQAKALQALTARRKAEKATQDELGLTRRPRTPAGKGGGGAAYVPLNSSAQQIRSTKRLRKYDQWQGVQRTDEDAARVVAKAIGGGREGEAAKPLRVEDVRARGAGRGSAPATRSPSPRPPSRTSSPESSGSRSPLSERGTPAKEAPAAAAVVDFF